MLLLLWFVFLISGDFLTSPLFVTSSEVEMERVGVGSVWAWSGLWNSDRTIHRLLEGYKSPFDWTDEC